ncbi:hypothetical protein D3C75_982340 [compost metagenome]
MQRAAGISGADRGADLEQHRAGIQTGLHAHHGHAAFIVAGFDRTLDRRGTAPAWQQRGVAVDAAQARNIQHHLRQDQAIGDHHHQVRLEGRQFSLSVSIAQGRRLQDLDTVIHSQLLDRAGHQFLPAPGRAVRLGVDGHHFIRAVDQGLEVFGGKLRGACKDNAHGVLA